MINGDMNFDEIKEIVWDLTTLDEAERAIPGFLRVGNKYGSLTVDGELYVVYEQFGSLEIDTAEMFIATVEDPGSYIGLDLEGDFQDEFWSDPPPLFHGTSSKSAEEIMREGLIPQKVTRGVTNRFLPAVVFATEDAELARINYGDPVFRIDTSAMAFDGYTPIVEREPGFFEEEERAALAHTLGVEYLGTFGWDGTDSRTVVIRGPVPPVYLSVETFRRSSAYTPDYTIRPSNPRKPFDTTWEYRDHGLKIRDVDNPDILITRGTDKEEHMEKGIDYLERSLFTYADESQRATLMREYELWKRFGDPEISPRAGKDRVAFRYNGYVRKVPLTDLGVEVNLEEAEYIKELEELRSGGKGRSVIPPARTELDGTVLVQEAIDSQFLNFWDMSDSEREELYEEYPWLYHMKDGLQVGYDAGGELRAFDGFMPPRFAGHNRTSAPTRTKLLNRAAELPEDRSEVVYTFDDGWTIRAVQDFADAYREGSLMGNCINPYDDFCLRSMDYHDNWGADHDQITPLIEEREPLSDVVFSLRDPDNIPHVSIDPLAGVHGDSPMALGRNNSVPKPEYVSKLREWMENDPDFRYYDLHGFDLELDEREGKQRVAKQASILDPVQDELDQRVFDGITPRSELFDPYLNRLKTLMRDNGWDPSAFSFWFNGSLCTYQYGPGSDVDVSIISNMSEEFTDEDRADLVRLVLTMDGDLLADGIDYPIQHFVQPPGVNIYDLFGAGIKAAYDLDKKRWLIQPNKDRAIDIESEYPDWMVQAVQIADKASSLLDAGHNEAAWEVYLDLHEKRKAEFERDRANADFSQANVNYKYFDRSGVMARVFEAVGKKMPGEKRSKLANEEDNDPLG